MSGRRAVWEVARREIVERSRSRVLRISFVLLLLLSVGGAVAAARLTGGTPTDDVGLVGARSAAVAPAIRAQARAADRRVRLHPYRSAAVARRAVHSGALDAALVDGRVILVERSSSTPAAREVQGAVAAAGAYERLRSAGLGRSEALAALTTRPLPVVVVDPGAKRAERNRGLVAVGLMFLFLALITFGQLIASSVTEEKSSRVVELLLTTLSPRRLLAGKVLGLGALGLAQLVVVTGAALVAGRLAGGAGLPSAAPEAVALIVVWFVLGYALFSVAYAAVGALVSRQQDLDTASAPITALMMAAFYLALLVALERPDDTLARVAAFVPPLAPMVVPARMVLGDMTALELGASIAVELLAIAALVVVAARIYERAILQIGAPVKLRRVLASGPAGRARRRARRRGAPRRPPRAARPRS